MEAILQQTTRQETRQEPDPRFVALKKAPSGPDLEINPRHVAWVEPAKKGRSKVFMANGRSFQVVGTSAQVKAALSR